MLFKYIAETIIKVVYAPSASPVSQKIMIVRSRLTSLCLTQDQKTYPFVKYVKPEEKFY
ncbi:MAG: hypothetical protein CM1200mP39_24520 [Dehalococcoidia bacterium]|nr:MAG: hypothetical protein CM1200mP39_24520 [Dehalococcoidia bacterium]